MIMAAVHVPTPLSHWLQEPFGYVSSAEGFIFMSAGLAGLVYGKIYGRDGWGGMARKAWLRGGKVYAAHLGVLIPMALIAWATAGYVAPLARHFHDFLQHPALNLALMPLLARQPPLFDILPLYVIFLGITPLLLAAARRCGWGIILLLSSLLWLAAQFGPGWHLAGPPAGRLHLHSGPFDLRAWQVIWVVGLALGQSSLNGALLRGPLRSWCGWIAGGVVAIGLLSRHGVLATPPDLYLLMNKWSLGPLRMLNFGAWAVLFLAWNPRIPSGLLAAPALLGRESLTVFSAHLPLVIGAGCLIQSLSPSAGAEVAIGTLVIGALFPVALWQERRSKRRPSVIVPLEPAARREAQSRGDADSARFKAAA